MIANKTTVTRGDVYLYWLRRYLTNPSVFLFFWIPIVCYVFFALRDHDPFTSGSPPSLAPYGR